jgi:hypothetical protein
MAQLVIESREVFLKIGLHLEITTFYFLEL